MMNKSGGRTAGKQVASGEAGVVLDMAVFKLETIPGDQQGGGSTTTFGNDEISGPGRGDASYFTRISDYDQQILATIPEPPTALLLVIGVFATLTIHRRNRTSTSG